MKNGIWKLGLALFLIGCTGVLSILTINLPIPEAMMEKVLEEFTPEQFKLLSLLNPLVLLIAMVVAGTVLHRKVNLAVPLLSNGLGLTSEKVDLASIVKSGVIGGLVAGGLMGLVGLLFYPLLPAQFIEFGEKVELSLAARFLYGGLTEEILMRYGWMTIIVFVVAKIIKGLPDKVYWIGILVAALIFAAGHLPIASLSGAPLTTSLFAYIILGNVIGGIVFGWLYWKKGLEAAFVAHIFAHVAMLATEPLIASMAS